GRVGVGGAPGHAEQGVGHLAARHERQARSRVERLGRGGAQADAPPGDHVLAPLVDGAGHGPDDRLITAGPGADQPVISPAGGGARSKAASAVVGSSPPAATFRPTNSSPLIARAAFRAAVTPRSSTASVACALSRNAAPAGVSATPRLVRSRS